MFHTKSRITQKLSKKLFTIYLFLYIGVLLIAMIFFLPYLYHSSKEKASSVTAFIKDDWETMQTNMQDDLSLLLYFNKLPILLKQYENSPTSANAGRLNLYLGEYESTKDSILFIIVDDCNGNIFSSINHSASNAISTALDNPNYQALYNRTKSTYFSPVYNDFFQIGTSDLSYSSVFLSQKCSLNSNPYIVTVFYNTDTILDRSSSLVDNVLDVVSIVNKSGEIICTSKDSFKNNIEEQNLFQKMTATVGCIKSKNGIYFYNSILSSTWTVICYASYYTLLKDVLTLLIMILVLYFVSPFLYSMFLVPTNEKYLAPLNNLSSQMNRYSIGQDPPPIITTSDEIEDLSIIFSNMIKKINLQAKDITKQEREKSITDYQLLATQVDPHFIYNTMNIINILARQNRNTDIIELNTALNRILRERLNTKSMIFETVEKEIETLKHYGLIMDYRYTNSVEILYDVDPAIIHQKIPKNILQPLVENAFLHGLTSDDGVIKGNITVMIYPLESNIIIEVSDNGKGIAPEKVQFLKEQKFNINQNQTGDSHIGMENIYNRLALIYENAFQIDIQSAPYFGTTIILTLPIDD